MNIRIFIVSILLLISVVAAGVSQEPDEKGTPASSVPMSIYITPYYNSEG